MEVWTITSGEYEDRHTWAFSDSLDTALAYLASQKPGSSFEGLRSHETTFFIDEIFDKTQENPEGLTEVHTIRPSRVIGRADL